eukprot:9614395-Alexandrium_andersonii.AAC.1
MSRCSRAPRHRLVRSATSRRGPWSAPPCPAPCRASTGAFARRTSRSPRRTRSPGTWGVRC